jgi:hypothetical protein
VRIPGARKNAAGSAASDEQRRIVPRENTKIQNEPNWDSNAMKLKRILATKTNRKGIQASAGVDWDAESREG